MASITIRNLDADVKARLRVFAARQGRSMEDAAREILRAALANRRPTPPRIWSKPFAAGSPPWAG